MPYEKKSVKIIIDEINSGKIYLPAIQRKYVWSEDQIIRLMDSILLGYPIGTFLFWKVNKNIINEKEYSLYEFIKNYHERDNFINSHAPRPIIKDEIYAVLDGQQRLTSLFISLQGSLAMKLPMKRWNNNDAFPQKELYINLKSFNNDGDDSNTYEFKFLSTNEASANTDKIWFKVKDIFLYESRDQLMSELVLKNNWNDKTVINNLCALHESLVDNEIINYFEVEKESIDDVLDIFIRVNSGGTILSKTDLLFSTVVSHWDKARDEIEDLLKKINSIGESFKFSNDFVMRTCLYLQNFPVHLKVESFKRDSVLQIKENWVGIQEAITQTVQLLNKFGFNFDNIVSYIAIIPIVYYVYHNGSLDEKNIFELKKYFIVAQLKQIFGVASNSTLTSIREILKNNCNNFNLTLFNSITFTGGRSFRFTEDELESLFEIEKNAYTFMLLSLLSHNLKFSQQVFHQDHLHPYSAFGEDNLIKLGFTNEGIIELQHDRNKLPNLQLLEGRENESKQDTPLIEWIAIDKNRTNAVCIPKNVSFDLLNFKKFYDARKSLIKEELRGILKI